MRSLTINPPNGKLKCTNVIRTIELTTEPAIKIFTRLYPYLYEAGYDVAIRRPMTRQSELAEAALNTIKEMITGSEQKLDQSIERIKVLLESNELEQPEAFSTTTVTFKANNPLLTSMLPLFEKMDQNIILIDGLMLYEIMTVEQRNELIKRYRQSLYDINNEINKQKSHMEQQNRISRGAMKNKKGKPIQKKAKADIAIHIAETV